jgi:hypothetical protein
MSAMFFYLNGVLLNAPPLELRNLSNAQMRRAFLDALDLIFDGAEAQLRVDLAGR